MRVAAAISPRATSPADTEPMKIVARLVDSVIAAARAPCRVKCSVVTNATAAGWGAAPPAPALTFWSLLVVSPAFRRRSGCDYRSSHEGAGACIWSLRVNLPSLVGTAELSAAAPAGLPARQRRRRKRYDCGSATGRCPKLRRFHRGLGADMVLPGDGEPWDRLSRSSPPWW